MSQLADAQACALRYHLLHELGLDERPQPPADRPAVTTEPDDATAPIVSQQTRLSASEQGTLAHRLLERLPLASSADEIAGALPELLRQEGADPAQHGELLASLEDLVRSPLGERLRSAERREGDLRRELPFALKLGPELVVHGQVDALLLEAGMATVIDYKHTEQRPVARYAAQLSAYALAAHQLLRGRAVQSGLVFLKSRGAFVAGPRISDANRAEAEGALRRAAHAIVTGIHSGEWPKAEPATCQSIDCGFYKRCHPPPAPG
ncbi:MAG: PD-(D/E)XK nuclease family protein [Deltaproteobacteria bacterium]|nr:PD-(D/E)XK nuclease family protein [Deltaproteobacteria bacterium]